MDLMKIAENVEVIDINKQKYLGILNNETGEIVNANECKELITRECFIDWLKKANLGTLKTIRMKGQQGYAVAKIDSNLRVVFDILVASMARAKVEAPGRMENMVFDEFIKEVK